MQFRNKQFKQLRWPKFDAKTEQEFKRDYNAKSVPVFRISLIIMIIVGIVPYAYLDLLMIPHSAKIAWIIRFGIWTPTLIVGIYLTYRQVILNYFQTVAFIVNFVLCFGVLAMIAISKNTEQGFTAYYSGLLVTISTIIMLRLRFKQTIIIIGSIVIGYVIVAVLKQNLHQSNENIGGPVILINNLFFLFSVALAIGIASYTLEYYARLNYWQRQQMVREKNLIKKKNIEIERQNKKIKKQNEEVKEMYSTKNKLFSIIAHDLKSPFNVLLGFSDLLIESCENKDYEDIDEFSHIIHDTSKKTLGLLDNLLDWSRLQTNSLKLNPEKINVKTLISENIDFYSNTANKKEIDLTFNKAVDVYVDADKNMLNTVVRNLISNAIKFSYPKKKIELMVLDNTESVEVLVVDEGTGISEEDSKKLFNFNSTVSKIGTENETGTGLGLVLCYNFIKLHRGDVWVESKCGEGSTFGFYLPK